MPLQPPHLHATVPGRDAVVKWWQWLHGPWNVRCGVVLALAGVLASVFGLFILMPLVWILRPMIWRPV